MNDVREAAICPDIGDAELGVGRCQGLVTRNRNSNQSGRTLSRKKIFSLKTEKRRGHVPIEFGTVGKIVVEALGPPGTGEREMDLPLPSPGLFAAPIGMNNAI